MRTILRYVLPLMLVLCVGLYFFYYNFLTPAPSGVLHSTASARQKALPSETNGKIEKLRSAKKEAVGTSDVNKVKTAKAPTEEQLVQRFRRLKLSVEQVYWRLLAKWNLNASSRDIVLQALAQREIDRSEAIKIARSRGMDTDNRSIFQLVTAPVDQKLYKTISSVLNAEQVKALEYYSDTRIHRAYINSVFDDADQGSLVQLNDDQYERLVVVLHSSSIGEESFPLIPDSVIQEATSFLSADQVFVLRSLQAEMLRKRERSKKNP